MYFDHVILMPQVFLDPLPIPTHSLSSFSKTKNLIQQPPKTQENQINTS